MKNKLKLMTLALSSIFSVSAHASTELIDDFLSLNGFATIGVVHSTNKHGDVVSNILQPTGAGYTHEYNWATMSKLGLQLNAKVSDSLEGVLQVVSEENYNGNFKPAIEWANIRYKITPDLAVRGGRIVLPVGMVSEYRKVGYANLTVQPNFDMYYTIPAFNSDGADITYTKEINDIHYTGQLLYGSTKLRIPSYFGSQNINVAELDKIKGVNLTAEKDANLFRVGYMRMNATYSGASINAIFNGLKHSGSPQAQQLADIYENDKKYIEVINAGFSTEQKNLIVQGEFTARNSAGFISDTKAWYVNTGYRFNKLTPYVGYSHMKVVSPNQSEPFYSTALNRNINLLLSAVDYSQSTKSVGMKYDLVDNVALKLQFDRVSPNKDRARSGILPKNADFDKNEATNVITLTTDFVF